MIFEEFQDCIVKEVQKITGNNGIVKINCVLKNNGVLLHGISIIKKNRKTTPSLYIDTCYEQYLMGKSIGSIVEEIVSKYNSTEGYEFNADFFTDYTQVKNKILPKLINYEKNRQMLESMPYKRIHDLAVVFYCLTGRKIEDGIIMIHNEHTKIWNRDVDEIYGCALENAPILCPTWIASLDDTVRGIADAGNYSGMAVVSGKADDFFDKEYDDCDEECSADSDEEYNDEEEYDDSDEGYDGDKECIDDVEYGGDKECDDDEKYDDDDKECDDDVEYDDDDKECDDDVEYDDGNKKDDLENENDDYLDDCCEKDERDSLEDKSFNTGMTILTNVEKTFGAGCILYPGMLEKMSKRCGGNFYILPSSVHEVIIMPDKAMGLPHSIPELRTIVRQVNGSSVATQDILSDSVYYYDKDTKELLCN